MSKEIKHRELGWLPGAGGISGGAPVPTWGLEEVWKKRGEHAVGTALLAHITWGLFLLRFSRVCLVNAVGSC